MRRIAFTLVELLVVIGIVALLMALLLPALQSARRHGVRVKCAAHLSQIGSAVCMYANEHKGSIPVALVYPAPGWPRGYHWFEHLAPYLQRQAGQEEIAADRETSVLWGCPAWDGQIDPQPDTYWGKGWKIGYGYNAWPLSPRFFGNSDAMMINREIGYDGRYFKLSEIRHHSERAMVTDAYQIYAGVGAWNPSAAVELQDYGTTSPTRHGTWASGSGANVLFYDGHVQAMAPKDLYFAIADPMRTQSR